MIVCVAPESGITSLWTKVVSATFLVPCAQIFKLTFGVGAPSRESFSFLWGKEWQIAFALALLNRLGFGDLLRPLPYGLLPLLLLPRPLLLLLALIGKPQTEDT